MNSSPTKDFNVQPSYKNLGATKNKPFTITLEKTVFFLCLLIGITVILTWFSGAEKVLKLSPGNATMKFNTAVVFLLIGINLRLFNNNKNQEKTVFNSLSAIIIIIGLLSVISYLGLQFLNIDNLIVYDTLSTEEPGLMSVATAICSILIGIGFLFSKSKKSSIYNIATKLYLTVNIISLLSIFSFFLLLNVDKQVSFIKSMSILTSILFYLISLVLLLKHPDSLVNRMFYGKNIGSVIFRKIIPNIILIPVILSNVLLILIDRGSFSFEFGIVLFVLILVTLGLLYVSKLADTLNESDKERKS